MSFLQHEDDEIETLLSEESNAIDPSTWETTSLPTPSGEESLSKKPKEIPKFCCHRSSYTLFAAWLSVSIFIGILLTVATDHRDEILQTLSQWTNQQQPLGSGEDTSIAMNTTIMIITDAPTTSPTTTTYINNNSVLNTSSLDDVNTPVDTLGTFAPTSTTMTYNNNSVVDNTLSEDHVDTPVDSVSSTAAPTTTVATAFMNNSVVLVNTSLDDVNIPADTQPSAAPTSMSTTTTTDMNNSSSVDKNSMDDPHVIDISQTPPPVEDKDDEEAPFVPYNNYQYRRVCANVYAVSTLCLTIRYPFNVPLQDPTVAYPKPVDERFYQLKNLMLLDEPKLDACRLHKGEEKYSNTTTTRRDDTSLLQDRIYSCLEEEARSYPNQDTAIALFTRKVVSEDGNVVVMEDVYGTNSALQRRRTAEFFRGHVMVVIGASPAPAVAHSISDLFEGCRSFGKGGGKNCDTRVGSNKRKRRLFFRLNRQLQQPQQPSFSLEEAWIRVVGYYPTDRRVEPTHIANTTKPILEVLRAAGIAAAEGWSATTLPPPPLRPMSLFVEFPIAHSQTEVMIDKYIDQVQYNQMRFTELVMNITSREARDELASTMGLQLAHVIAFDGLPQHFPSATGAYPSMKTGINSEASFLEQPYPNWHAELGSSCRGPLPRNSRLKQVNDWERVAFQQYHGFDMKFYAKIWEFSNQFWWQERMWNGKGGQLDCTHGQGQGPTIVHKYFVQAMVDGYYESQHQAM